MRFPLLPALAFLALLAPTALRAQLLTENYSFTLNATIPDNDPGGVASTQVLSSAIGSITNVQVTLTISGGFNGDYYAYLYHQDAGGGEGFAVLLNRVGRDTGAPNGYADSGFTSVTFAGSAINDIHSYHSVSNPGAGNPLVGGLWTVDGRETDPSLVSASDPRTALLSSFNGLAASGEWTLYLADVAPLGQGTFVSWNLQITGVPEPSTWIVGALAAGFLVWRSHRSYRSDRTYTSHLPPLA